MRILLCLLLALSFSLPAQVNLIIEDESGQGFYLGVNKFLQHPEAHQKVILKDLDTIPYSLQIETDTFNFSKNIHLRQAGTYRYLLHKNSRGQLRLRFRGEGQAGPDYQSLSYSRDIPWPQSWQPKAPPVQIPAPPVVAKTGGSVDEKEKNRQLPLSMPDSLVKNAEVLLPHNDTARGEKILITVSEGKEEVSFPELLKEMEGSAYEFERLKLALDYTGEQSLTTAEVVQLFRQFQYDHTRLDFLRQILPAILDPQHLNLLEKELEYILSRQKLKEIIRDEK